MKRNNIPHLGWIGDYGQNKGYTSPFSHKISLNKLLFPVLKELDFDFTFTILGIRNINDKKEIQEYFSDTKNITLNIPVNIDWLDENSIYDTLKDFDLGVSPMINHDFNIAKSAFKAKQYLSCGVPVLASPVGENLDFVKDGLNGYICKSSREWIEKINEIISMPEDRYMELSRNARESTDAFSMEHYCSKLLEGISNTFKG